MKLSEVTGTQKPALKLSQVTAATVPVQKPAQEKPGLLKRSLSRLETGLSDFGSTMMGDTYGYHGDPTQPDNLGIPGRVLKAAGGDVIPAAAGIVTDAAMTAGKAVTPQPVQNAISSGVDYAMQSAPAQAIGKGLEQWKKASPESYNTAGWVANIAGTKLPVATPKFSGAARNLKGLKASIAAKERQQLTRRFEPSGADIFDYGGPKEGIGSLKQNTFEPNPYYSGVIDEVAQTPGVSLDNSHTVNREALAKHTTTVKNALDEKLQTAPAIPSQTIDDAMIAAKARAADKTLLTGNAESPAERLYKKFNELMTPHIDETTGTVRPEHLLDVRRKLDNFVEDAKMADPFTESGKAANVAVREMRSQVNDLVAAADPSVGVKDDLAKMNRLLTARDVIKPRSLEELNTNKYTRGLRTIEEKTGFRHPLTTLGVERTASSLPATALAGGAALIAHSGGEIANAAKKGSAYADLIMADVLRRGTPTMQRAAIISAANSKKKKESNDATQ